MQPFQSLSIALVASLSLLAATSPSSSALASQVDVNSASYKHHFARGHGHNSVRSVVLDHGKKLKAKRATQAQQEAAARAKQWSDDFATQNSAWQAAANADLKQGKTPQDFDTWAASNGGRDGKGHDSPESNSSSGSSSSSSSQGVQSQQNKQNQDDSQQDNSSSNGQDDDEDEDDDEDQDEGDDDDDDDDEDEDDSSSSSASSPSSTSSASSSKATAAKKQAYKQDDSSSKSSSQKSNNNSSNKSSSSSKGSSGSGLLAGIANVVTGGQATFYNTGLGACGWTNKDSDYIVALPVGVWNRIGGSVSNGNIVCGKKLKVSNGKTAIEVEITDQCPSCDDGHLDLSPAAFKSLGAESQGVLPISWGWVNGEPHK
ncbi:unnamed protein product [Sympodiomycopsis kandeliae]